MTLFARACVLILSRLSLALVGLCAPTYGFGQPSPEDFDGSFRLRTGEVVTGGYFVEEAQGRYVYMDTEGLEKGGLFERIGNETLRSIGPPEIEIEFVADADGKLNALIWRQSGHEPIPGERIYSHSVRAVGFHSGDGTRLHGRLLLPECAGPHPLVVSVHGSGPVNRYGGPFHTFFLKFGMALLAYDKRGFTTEEDAWREPDLATLSADAAAAVRFAASLPEIDRERIGFFGSSQAGWVVPPAAIAAPETDFQILRAGAALSSAETVLHEVRQELRAEGMSGLNLDNAIHLRREIYALAMSGAPISTTDSLVEPYLDKPWYRDAFGERPISEQWSARSWAWARRNHAVTPIPSLERFEGPVLWFLAEKDENVPLVPTRAALERAFATAPGDDHEIVVIDEAPHSFVIVDAERTPRYADGFFDYMGKWIVEHGYSDKECRSVDR